MDQPGHLLLGNQVRTQSALPYLKSRTLKSKNKKTSRSQNRLSRTRCTLRSWPTFSQKPNSPLPRVLAKSSSSTTVKLSLFLGHGSMLSYRRSIPISLRVSLATNCGICSRAYCLLSSQRSLESDDSFQPAEYSNAIH